MPARAAPKPPGAGKKPKGAAVDAALAEAPRKAAPASASKRGTTVGRAKPAAALLKPAVGVEEEHDEIDELFLEKLAGPLRAMRNYFRLKVDGLDNIPEGPALLVANHTGWLGFDYALTALSVYDAFERLPRGMAHAAWFQNPTTRRFAKKVGLFQVTKDAMAQQLAKGHLVMLFPEGEKGAFRPGSDYVLEPFARGFVRVAMATQVPVVPVAILGGEESNPVGTRIESYEQLLNIKGGLPIPRNLLPKPVKWRIRFLKPLPFTEYTAQDADDTDRVHAVAEDVRTRVQRELRKMKVERGHPYL